MADEDADGICDDIDDCVGALDECGICNGPGAIYECGCSDIPEGDCDCDGNQLDAIEVCGGDCAADADADGICDDVDDCVVRTTQSVAFATKPVRPTSTATACVTTQKPWDAMTPWRSTLMRTPQKTTGAATTKAS